VTSPSVPDLATAQEKEGGEEEVPFGGIQRATSLASKQEENRGGDVESAYEGDAVQEQEKVAPGNDRVYLDESHDNYVVLDQGSEVPIPVSKGGS
jgi:hypothetical protein